MRSNWLATFPAMFKKNAMIKLKKVASLATNNVLKFCSYDNIRKETGQCAYFCDS